MRCASKICVLMLLSVTLMTNAQKQQIDSLLAPLRSPQDDSLKCVYLRAYVEFETDNNVWPLYNEKLRKISEERMKSATGKARAFYLQMLSDTYINDGFLNQQNGRFSEALNDYHKSLQIKFDINDREGVASNLVNIGYVYFAAADYEKATFYFNKALKIQEEIKDKGEAALTMANLANVFWRQHDTTKFLELVNKSMAYRKEIGDKLGIAKCYNLLVMAERRQTVEVAFDYSFKALKIFQELNYKDGVANTLNNLGGLHYRVGKTKEAKEYYLQALDINKAIKDYRGMSVSLYNLGDIYAEEGKGSKALELYKDCYKFASMSGELKELKTACGGLAKLYLKLGRKAEHERYSRMFSRLTDSIEKKIVVKLEDPHIGAFFADSTSAKDREVTQESVEEYSYFWWYVAGGASIVLLILILFLFLKRP